MRLRSFRFNRVQERRYRRGAAKTEQHQAEVKRKNEMRDDQQEHGKGRPAQIREDAGRTLDERDGRIF